MLQQAIDAMVLLLTMRGHHDRRTISPSGKYPIGRIAQEIATVVRVVSTTTDEYILFLNGRLVAELYIMLMEHVSGRSSYNSNGLYSGIMNLPNWAWEYRCSHYVDANPGLRKHCGSMDLDFLVWKDLHYLRKCGNIGVHAILRMTHSDSILRFPAECDMLEENPQYAQKVREAVYRIGLVAAVWATRMPQARL